MLVAGSVVGISGSATALEPVPNLFTVNVANQSASSYARDFVVLGSKTYFTASSVSYGRSIWSLAATSGATPQLVLDPVAGAIHGKIEKMTAVGNYLLFWLNDQRDGRGDFVAVAYNLVTHAMTKLAVSGTEITSSSEVNSNFAVVVGGSGSVAYVIGGQNDVNSQKLYAFDLTTGVASVADAMVGLRVTNNYRDGLDANGQNWHPTLSAVGSKLYIANFVSVSPPAGSYCVSWGMSDWSELRAFDTVASSWGSPVQVVGEDFALAGATIQGTFDYAGERVVLSAAASVKGCYFSHTFQYYATKADGTTIRLGTWTTSGQQGTDSYVNFNGSLYFMQGGLWKIDPVTGERTNSAATMFPSAAAVALRNAVVVDGHLVFAAQAMPSIGDYRTPFYLYQWDGTSAATRLETASLGQAIGVAPNTPSIYDWYTNGNTDYEALAAIGLVGTKAITSLNVDGATGGEPYLISLDDSKTLVGNLNKASDGSDPDTDCFANFDNIDFMSGNLPMQTSGWGKDVFVELKGEDGFLKYSVLDPGNISNMCGYVVIGADLYFTAEDTVTYNNALYRMGVDRVVHKVVDVPQQSVQGFTNGTDYIFRANNDYNTDWWMWNATSNDVTKITGTGTDLIQSDSVRYGAVQIGSTAYFTASPQSGGDDAVWALDLAHPTTPPVRITPERASGVDSWPGSLTVVAGKLVFGDAGLNPSGALNGGDSVYVYDPATRQLKVLFDPAADGADGYIERIFAVGDQVVVIYHADSDPSDTNKIFRATIAGVVTPLTFPSDFAPYCAAPAGNDIAVTSDAGNAFFYRQGGSTMVPISYSFVGDTYALCGSVSSVNGTYLSIPEYPFDYGPWASEPGYLGFLTPIAVERLGEPVVEPPASPYSPTPPPADAPGSVGTPTATIADSSINLSWSAPTTGGAVGGYRITSTPAGALCVIVGTTASCTGLTVGVEYTFTVEAYNINGFGSSSSLSNSVTAPAGSDSGFGGGGGTGSGSGGGGSGGGGTGGGSGGGAGGSGGGSGNSAAAGLAATGFDSQEWILLGVLALGAGAFLTVRGARRRANR